MVGQRMAAAERLGRRLCKAVGSGSKRLSPEWSAGLGGSGGTRKHVA